MKLSVTTLITSCALIISSYLPAEIIKTSRIEEILPQIEPGTLVLFNVAEVLMDTETTLGTSAWRRFVRKKIDARAHDLLTLYVFKNVPPKVPEANMPDIISELQKQGTPIFAFTSRGRAEWYSSKIDNIDILTEGLLKSLNIDFTHTVLPPELANLDEVLSDYYHSGIFYTGNAIDKGEFLQNLFQMTGYKPNKIVFVDDKQDSLESVEKMMQELDIPFVGFAYNKTSLEHKKFDLMIANIQLSWLIFAEQILSDEDAMMIKIETQVGVDPDQYFNDLLEKVDWDYLYQKRLGINVVQ